MNRKNIGWSVSILFISMIWEIACGVPKSVSPKVLVNGDPSSELVEEKISSSIDTVTLGKPLSQDASKKLSDWYPMNIISGREAHNLWTDPSDTTKSSFFMLNEIEHSKKITTRAFPVVKPILGDSIGLTDAEILNGRSIFDPQFSPNGRYILFKFGYIASPGTYRIYIFDTLTGKTKLACLDYLCYYAVSWSPDSNYIAFAKGGEVDPRVYDNGRTYEGKLQLFTCNWRTGETQQVISSGTLRGPWAWRAPHTLLYSALSPQDEIILRDPTRETGIDFINGEFISWERVRGTSKQKPVSPNTYEYDIDKRISSLLVKDAYLPVASPDGKRLAFFGSAKEERPFALKESWQYQPTSTFIVVSEGNSSNSRLNTSEMEKRVVLSQHSGRYPDLIWTPDGKRLLVLEQVADVPNARLNVREWDVQTQKSRLVTTLKATDPDNSRSSNSPIFRALSLSDNGRNLMILVDEHYLLEGNKGALNKGILQDINLVTGEITTVGQIRAAFGVSWTYS